MGTAPGIGIDLLEPQRLAEKLRRNPAFGETLFTDQEREYCAGQSYPEQHLTARFCAKEAVIKALGIDGWDPLDVEIIDGGPDVHVQLHGEVEAVAAALGVTVTVSMTHLASIAGAVALARPTGEVPASGRHRATRGSLTWLACCAKDSRRVIREVASSWETRRRSPSNGRSRR